jgi:hypothetical protein
MFSGDRGIGRETLGSSVRDNADVALRMTTTEGTVRVYVCEARAQLKILLKRR